MNEEPYVVTVVLDAGYGERLLTLPEDIPVWIVDTPVNRAAAEKAWAQRKAESHLHGVTMFKFNESASTEEILIGRLDTINLHHGVSSADPPFTELEVIGTSLTERIKVEMAHFGFDQFSSRIEGFRAVRSLPTDEPQ